MKIPKSFSKREFRWYLIFIVSAISISCPMLIISGQCFHFHITNVSVWSINDLRPLKRPIYLGLVKRARVEWVGGDGQISIYYPKIMQAPAQQEDQQRQSHLPRFPITITFRQFIINRLSSPFTIWLRRNRLLFSRWDESMDMKWIRSAQQ